MNQMAVNIADALVGNLAARNDWDEPAQLYWLDLTKGQVRLDLFPIDQDIFTTGHPPEVLAALTQAIEDQKEMFRRVIPPSLIGIAFFCEAWTVNFKTSEEARRAAGRRDTQPLSSHPQRIEQRTIIALERSGLRFYVSQPRDGEIESEVEHVLSDNPHHSGLIPAVLAQLLNAILSTDMPPTRKTV